MKKNIKLLLGLVITLSMVVFSPANKVYAGSEIPDYFDFGYGTVSIPAGGEQQMWLRSSYNYNYYIKGNTSDATYLDCDFKEGSRYVTIHIGPDEQGGNVFFHFYVQDDRIQDSDIHDCVEVYVQNRLPLNDTLSAPIARGKTGTLVKKGMTSMLYNDQGVPMASFSLTKGEGHMANYGQQAVVSYNGANYFALATGFKGPYPVISSSDKAVMQANGYAGVCVNGTYYNWP